MIYHILTISFIAICIAPLPLYSWLYANKRAKRKAHDLENYIDDLERDAKELNKQINRSNKEIAAFNKKQTTYYQELEKINIQVKDKRKELTIYHHAIDKTKNELNNRTLKAQLDTIDQLYYAGIIDGKQHQEIKIKAQSLL